MNKYEFSRKNLFGYRKKEQKYLFVMTYLGIDLAFFSRLPLD